MNNLLFENMKALQIPELKSIYEMLSLKDKTAFVTGGAGGFGRSCAAGMAEVGANIMLMDIPEREGDLKVNVEEISNRYGNRTLYTLGDVSDEKDVKRMLDETVQAFNSLDIVFSNAGIPTRTPVPVSIPPDEWNHELDVNLTGMMLVNRTSADIMRELGHGGSIINTASMSGLIILRQKRDRMNRHMMSYAVTKAAIIQLSKSIAMNYATDKIRCNSISPGVFLSGMHDSLDKTRMNTIHEDVPLNRVGNLNEIMGIVLYLASDLSSYVTGANFVIDGGYTVW